jgi:hypothetical protein
VLQSLRTSHLLLSLRPKVLTLSNLPEVDCEFSCGSPRCFPHDRCRLRCWSRVAPVPCLGRSLLLALSFPVARSALRRRGSSLRRNPQAFGGGGSHPTSLLLIPTFALETTPRPAYAAASPSSQRSPTMRVRTTRILGFGTILCPAGLSAHRHLDEVYHPIRAAIPNSPTRRNVYIFAQPLIQPLVLNRFITFYETAFQRI